MNILSRVFSSLALETSRLFKRFIYRPRDVIRVRGICGERGIDPDRLTEGMGSRERIVECQVHISLSSNSTAPKDSTANMFCG